MLDFETFWNLYNKKKGTKQAKDKFLKLPQKDVDKILLTVKSFVGSIKDKQFQPLPTSYLNGERWNDEISEVKNIKFAQKIFL